MKLDIKKMARVDLSQIPRISTPATWPHDIGLWENGSPPSTRTVRRWINEGRLITCRKWGKVYIDNHATLLAAAAPDAYHRTTQH